LHWLLCILGETSSPSPQGSEVETWHLLAKDLDVSPCFPNMRDIFQSQLSAKMIKHVESLDFQTREDCNYRCPTGSCPCGNVCRIPVAVCKVKCKTSETIVLETVKLVAVQMDT
jgi:hypothetical protein